MQKLLRNFCGMLIFAYFSANFNKLVTSSTEAPSKTGVAIGIPNDKFIDNSSNSFLFREAIFALYILSP